MKQYFAILAALLSYGCVTQPPKEVTPPQNNRIEAGSVESGSVKASSAEIDYSDKVDSKQLDSTSQADVKVSKIVVPKTSSKATPKKKVIKESVFKKQPVESSKTALTTKKLVKIDSSQLSPGKQVEPKVTPIPPLETSTKKQAIETTPLTTKNLEPDNSITVDSEQVSSDNLTDSNVTQIIIPETNLELDIETKKQVNEDTPIESNNLDFDLDKLPLSFGGTWILDRNKDKISNTTRCLLSSQEQNFNDGYSNSKISLQLATNTLLIKTNSSIDLSYPGVGIFIDQNEAFPLKNLFGETSVLIKNNIQKITSQLLNGEKLTVKLGFWPTWPKTEIRSIDFLLSDFNEAYQSFLACEKL